MPVIALHVQVLHTSFLIFFLFWLHLYGTFQPFKSNQFSYSFFFFIFFSLVSEIPFFNLLPCSNTGFRDLRGVFTHQHLTFEFEIGNLTRQELFSCAVNTRRITFNSTTTSVVLLLNKRLTHCLIPGI